MDTTTTNWTLSADDLAATIEKADKTNAKLARLGIDARFEVIATPIDCSYKTVYGQDITVTNYSVVIAGGIAAFPGNWQLAATLDIDAAGNIVRTNPMFDGAEIPSEYRSVSGHQCDHCGLVRERKTSVLVWSATEGFKVIGKSCVQAFLGIDPNSIFRIVDEDLWALSPVRSERRGFYVADFVHAAAVVTLIAGFVPKSAEMGEPTAWIVEAILGGGTADFWKSHSDLRDPAVDVLDAARTLAVESLQWIESIDADNDYMRNLKTAAAREMVGNNAGLLASLPNAYRKHIAKQAESAVRAERPVRDEWIAEVGTKTQVVGSVVFTNRGEPYGGYGAESLYVIVATQDGATVSISTTVDTVVGQALEALNPQDVVTIAGTVKAHKTNTKGRKVTALTRTKIVS